MSGLIRNKKYKTAPLIAHNPFLDLRTCDLWRALLRWTDTLKVVKIPDDLTIVTWNNRETKGLLQLQLERLGIDYLNLAQGIRHWDSNRIKPKVFIEKLTEIKTSYVLGLDCFDVAIVNDLAEIITKFKNKKCRALFNATATNYPAVAWHQTESERLCKDVPFVHFNSGAFIGEKEYLRDFFAAALAGASNEFRGSDQFLMKPIYFKQHPEVLIDSSCEIFQVMYVDVPGDRIENYVTLPRIKHL